MQELRCKANTRSPSPSSLPLPPGANSVVACEMQESLCDVARKAAAANGLSDKISIIQRDGGLLQRGREVRALGVNVVVADVFDAGAVPRLRFLLVSAAALSGAKQSSVCGWQGAHAGRMMQCSLPA